MLCPGCWGEVRAAPLNDPSCLVCDDKQRIPDSELSSFFLLSEFLQSASAVRAAIDNAPTPAVVANLQALVIDLLHPIRLMFGPVVITSGYRSPVLNRATSGSSPTSAHPEGNAADFHCVRHSNRQVFDAIVASHLEFDQLIFEGTWLHIGRRKAGITKPRREILQCFGGKYSPFNPLDPRCQ